MALISGYRLFSQSVNLFKVKKMEEILKVAAEEENSHLRNAF